MLAGFICLYSIFLLCRYDTTRTTSDAITFPKLIQWIEFFVRIIWFKIKFKSLINKLKLTLYSRKGNSTGWGEPYLVELNCSGRPMITDFGCLTFWSPDILVANIVDFLKWSDSKNVTAYIGTLLGYYCLRLTEI